MTEANSRGTRLSVGVVTPGCRVTHWWTSCNPGTGTLSPSAGLWYPGGETMRRLTVERLCDSIHMLCMLWFQVTLYLHVLNYIRVSKQE